MHPRLVFVDDNDDEDEEVMEIRAMSTFSRLVFPAPEGPSSAVTLPRGHRPVHLSSIVLALAQGRAKRRPP